MSTRSRGYHPCQTLARYSVRPSTSILNRMQEASHRSDGIVSPTFSYNMFLEMHCERKLMASPRRPQCHWWFLMLFSIRRGGVFASKSTASEERTRPHMYSRCLTYFLIWVQITPLWRFTKKHGSRRTKPRTKPGWSDKRINVFAREEK